MTLEDTFKLYVSAYYGISEMDEYTLKVYILKDIENKIRIFAKNNFLSNDFYEKEVYKIEHKSLREKLQDALLVLQMIDGPLELKMLINTRIKNMDFDKHN